MICRCSRVAWLWNKIKQITHTCQLHSRYMPSGIQKRNDTARTRNQINSLFCISAKSCYSLELNRFATKFFSRGQYHWQVQLRNGQESNSKRFKSKKFDVCCKFDSPGNALRWFWIPFFPIPSAPTAKGIIVIIIVFIIVIIIIIIIIIVIIIIKKMNKLKYQPW